MLKNAEEFSDDGFRKFDAKFFLHTRQINVETNTWDEVKDRRYKEK
jgi:hypothetical protein